MSRVFAPASIGNVGPGFDVLGLAVEGLGDEVEVTLGGGGPVTVTGRDAELVPTDPRKNAASIAARAFIGGDVTVSIHKGLPLSGGLGGSAASSVGGALAAALASRRKFTLEQVLEAALEGEAYVAGRHYDNLAPCLYGGLVLVLPREKPVLVPIAVRKPWWLALVTPVARLETKKARSVLSGLTERKVWIEQMANTTGLALAFSTGDAALLRATLHDVYAEPARAPLIPRFAEAKAAALKAGALGCSISGAGPTLFAVAESEATARKCARAMLKGFGGGTAHVGRISKKGAREIKR